jgi:hypothetical protein
MKFVTLAILALSVYCASTATVLDASLNNVWESFKTEHAKQYHSADEEFTRRLIWESNFRLINKHNDEYKMGKHTYTVKMNKFGDMTNLEFKRMMNGFNMTAYKSTHKESHLIGQPWENMQLPTQVDW